MCYHSKFIYEKMKIKNENLLRKHYKNFFKLIMKKKTSKKKKNHNMHFFFVCLFVLV